MRRSGTPGVTSSTAPPRPCSITPIHLFSVALIIVVGLFTYGATVQFPFHWDDYRTIVDNPSLDSPSDLGAVFSYWPTRVFLFWTFSIDRLAGSRYLEASHLTNIGIHLLAAILLYLVLYKTLVLITRHAGLKPGTTGNEGSTNRDLAWSALIAALLFTVHPVATGAVTYLVQRGVVLSTALGLLSLLCYIGARNGFFSSRRGFFAPGHLFLYGFSLLSLLLALLTKEGALVFPVLIAGWELIFGGKGGKVRHRLLYLVPFLAAIFIIPLISLATLPASGGGDDFFYTANIPWRMDTVVFYDAGEETYLFNRWEYFVTQIKSIAIYVRLTFLPVNQNFYYLLEPKHSLFSGSGVVLLMGYIGVLLVGLRGVMEYWSNGVMGSRPSTTPSLQHSNTPALKLIGCGIFWFFICLLPTSSFLILWPFLSEYHLYLSLAGLSFLAVGLMVSFRGRERRRLCRTLLLTVILAFSLLAVKRNAVYSSAVSLWEDTVKKSPRLAAARSNLAAAYIGKGEYEKAIAESRKAMELNPLFNGYRNLRTAYRARGKWDEAEKLIREEIQRFPESYRGHYELGLILREKEPEEARRAFRSALEKNPPPAIRSRIKEILEQLDSH